MGNMFNGCKSLEDLDLSSFNTSNLSGMSNMFYGCESLKSLNLSNFNVSNLKGQTALHQTFSGCSNLKTLNLTGWKVVVLLIWVVHFIIAIVLKHLIWMVGIRVK